MIIVDEYQSKHFLFGKPQVLASQDDLKYCLLTNEDYVLAYDKTKRTPFYVSYILIGKVFLLLKR